MVIPPAQYPDLIRIINREYTDGLDRILSAQIDEDDRIVAYAQDGFKRIWCEISDTQIRFRLLGAGESVEFAEAGELEFAMSDLEVEFKIPEGTIKEKNGKKYVLTNSRWRLAEPKEKKPKSKTTPKKKALSDKSKAVVEDVQKAAGVTPKAKGKKVEKQEIPKPVALVDNFDRIAKTEKELGVDKLRDSSVQTENTTIRMSQSESLTPQQRLALVRLQNDFKKSALIGSLDVNAVTPIPKGVSPKTLTKSLANLPDGHRIGFDPTDRESFDRLGLKPLLGHKLEIDDNGDLVDNQKYPHLVAEIRGGKAVSIPQSEVKKIANIRAAREKATVNMERIHFDNEGNPRGAEDSTPLQRMLNMEVNPITSAAKAKILAAEDKHHEKIDKLENAYLGRKPTGKHGDYDSYEQRSSDWAKAKFGDFTEGANGFSLAQTKAHDIAHPVTHDLIGMDSDAIHKHFGKMKDANGADALYAEEAIVNVMEQLSRGVSIEAATLNGVRLARVMTRGGVGSKEAAEYVRSPEFAQKLTQAANHAYRHDDFAPLIAHVRKSNRLSGTVRASGDNFSNSASGG